MTDADDKFGERWSRIQEAKDRGDVEYLIDALIDPDHRWFAAKSLGELGADEATGPLIRLLSAADPHARSSAASALGKIGSTEALPLLRELAAQDDELWVRASAVYAIGDIGGGAEATNFLLPFLLDPSMRVRGATAYALGRLGDPRAKGAVVSARRRLRRSPFEWWAWRRAYDKAIERLSRQPIERTQLTRDQLDLVMDVVAERAPNLRWVVKRIARGQLVQQVEIEKLDNVVCDFMSEESDENGNYTERGLALDDVIGLLWMWSEDY